MKPSGINFKPIWLLAAVHFFLPGNLSGQTINCIPVNRQELLGKWNFKWSRADNDSLHAQSERMHRNVQLLTDSLTKLKSDNPQLQAIREDLTYSMKQDSLMHEEMKGQETIFIAFEADGTVSSSEKDISGKWSFLSDLQLLILTIEKVDETDSFRVCSPSPDTICLMSINSSKDTMYFSRQPEDNSSGDKTKPIK